MILIRIVLKFRSTQIKPSSAKCVIFLPHPDDEVFGMGGTIAAKVAAGAECRFILATLGEKSHNDCCPGIEYSVIANRRAELYRSLAALGLSQPTVIDLGLEDSGLAAMKQAEYDSVRNKLKDILLEYAPQEVYYPILNDSHPDHTVLSKLCVDAISQTQDKFHEFRYIVWGWYLPSNKFYNEILCSKILRVDTEDWSVQKKNAIDAYIKSTPAPCGAPYGGRLPSALIASCSRTQEFFLS